MSIQHACIREVLNKMAENPGFVEHNCTTLLEKESRISKYKYTNNRGNKRNNNVGASVAQW